MSEHTPSERVDDRPLKRIEKTRYCRCGTRLSPYNKGKLCAQCDHNDALLRVERVGAKRIGTRLGWTRELTLQPVPGTVPPERLAGEPAIADLLNIVAYECGVTVEELNTPRHGGYYARQTARTIFIYLVYKDICKTHQFKPAAIVLNIDPQRVRYAKVSIEHELPRPEITDAIVRARRYYQHTAASAA